MPVLLALSSFKGLIIANHVYQYQCQLTNISDIVADQQVISRRLWSGFRRREKKFHAGKKAARNCCQMYSLPLIVSLHRNLARIDYDSIYDDDDDDSM